MTIQAGDLALLRADGHKVTPYISFLEDVVLFSARVNNASIARAARTIAFDGGSGTYTAVEAGMTVYIGSTAGASDKGVERLKGITSGDGGTTGTITMGTNSVTWADNDYITVIHKFEVWSVQPYIDDNGTFYKDRDVAYSNQNTNLLPVCVAGPHRGVLANVALVTSSVANDSSANNYDSAASYGAATNVVGSPVVFNGNNSWIDVTNSTWQAGISYFSTVSFACAFKVDSAAVWTDGVERVIARVAAGSGSGYIELVKAAANNTLTFRHHDGTSLVTESVSESGTGWIGVCLWVEPFGLFGISFLHAIVDGSAFGGSTGGLSLVATAGSAIVGAGNTSGARSFKGQIRNLVMSATGDFITDLNDAIALSEDMRDDDVTTTKLNSYFGNDGYVWYKLDELVTATTASLELSLTSSYATKAGATISSHAVTVYPSATATVGTPTGMNYPITFSAAGQYWIKATVTDSGGRVSPPRRIFVKVHHPTDSPPFAMFDSIQMTGAFQRGGWTASVSVYDDADLSTIRPGTLAVVWADHKFGASSDPIGMLHEGNEVLLSGYVSRGQITEDAATGGYYVFDIVTIEQIMRERYLLSFTLESKASPSAWWHFINGELTTGNAIHHALLWHSTVMNLADVVGLNNDGDIQRKYLDMEEGNLYDIVNSFASERSIHARVVSDKWGRLHLAWDLAYRNDAARSGASVYAAITDADRSGPVTITHDPSTRVGFVFASGFNYDGTTATPLGSTAPGEAPGNRGGAKMMVENLMLTGQSQINELSGQILAVLNNEYPELRVPFKGNYLGWLDVAEQKYWTMSVDGIRDLNKTDWKLLCRAVEASISNGAMQLSATFEPEVNGTDGVTYLFPDTTPVDYPSPPVFTEDFGGDGDAYLTASSLYYLPVGDGTTWTLRTSSTIHDVKDDPYWPTRQNSNDPKDAILLTAETGQIRRSLNCGQTWTTLSPGNPPNSWSDAVAPTFAACSVRQVESLPGQGDFVWMVRWQNAASKWRTWLLTTSNDGATFTWTPVGLSCGTYATSPQTVRSGLETYTAYPGTFKRNIVAVSETEVWGFFSDNEAPPYDQYLYAIYGVVNSEGYISWGSPHYAPNFSVVVGGATCDGAPPRAVVRDAIIVSPNYIMIAFAETDCGGCDGSGPFTYMGVVQITGADSLVWGSLDYESGPPADNLNACTCHGFGEFAKLSDGVVAWICTGQVKTAVLTGTGSSAYMAYKDIQVISGGASTYGLYGRIARLTDTTYIAVTNTGMAAHHTINATTYEITQNATFDFGNITPYYAMYVEAGKVAVFYTVGNTATTTIKYRILTWNGSTLTASAAQDLVTNATGNQHGWISDFSHALAGSTYVFSYVVSGGYRYATFTYASGSFAPCSSVSISDGTSTYQACGICSLSSSRSIAMFSHDNTWKTAVIASGVAEEAYGVNIAVDSLYIYCSLWVTGNYNIIQTIDIATLALVYEVTATVATLAQVQGNTQVGRVAADGLGIYVYGRMLLDGSPIALSYSSDGATFTTVQSGWGSDYAGVCLAYAGSTYVVRNISGGGAAKLYTSSGTTSALTLKRTYPVNYGSKPKGATTDWNGNFVATADAGNAVMVFYLPPPYNGAWFNITGNHSTANAVNTVIAL